MCSSPTATRPTAPPPPSTRTAWRSTKSELQPGDAVFFASSSQAIGHVGIYIGDGQFIHSSSGAGYVTINSLDESYYSRMYVGARRIAY